MNQNGLAGFGRAGSVQHLPCRRARDRQGRGHCIGECGGGRCKQGFGNRHIVGVCASAGRYEAMHPVTDSEAASGGGGMDFAGQFKTERSREDGRHDVLEVAFADFPIETVDAGRPDADHDKAGAGLGQRCFGQLDRVGAAEPGEDDCAVVHVVSPFDMDNLWCTNFDMETAKSVQGVSYLERMDLEALADFVLVATHGGLGRASRQTGRSKATLSRKVSELEQALQVRLVDRGARQLRLTADGEALFARTRGLLGEMLQAGDDIRNGGGSLSGLLRISAPVLFSHVALSRVAAAFSRSHPQLQIEINAEDRFVDPVEEGYDLVVRTNPKPTESMVGRRLFTDELVLVAAPEIGRPLPGAAVAAVLMSRLGEVRAWSVESEGTEMTFQPEPVLRLSSILMVHEAVRAGAGAAVLPLSLVARDLGAGALVQWGRVLNRPIEVWILHAAQRLSSPKVTTFMAFVAKQFPTGLLEL